MRTILHKMSTLMMGAEKNFRCVECNYQYPHHADGCSSSIDNLRKR